MVFHQFSECDEIANFLPLPLATIDYNLAIDIVRKYYPVDDVTLQDNIAQAILLRAQSKR